MFFRTDSAKKITLFLIIALTLAGCSTMKIKTAMRDGDTLALQERWDEALDRYLEVAEQMPQDKEYRLKVEKAKYEASLIHIKKGEDLLGKKDYDRALLEFQVAAMLNPSLRKAKDLGARAKKQKDADYYYRTGLTFIESNKKNEARAAFKKVLFLDPKRDDAATALEKLKKERKTVVGGYELNLKSDKPITLKFKSTAITDVFDIISKLSGINFILDEGVKRKKATLYIEDATFEQALDLVLMTNRLFKKVVNENTIIIIPNTKQKRQQYEDLIIHTFYLSSLDAKKAVNLLRTLLQIKSIYVNEMLNTIVVRDTPEVIALAEKVLQANDQPDAEIMLEVEILEVQKSATENLGLDLSPDTITAGLREGGVSGSKELTYNTLKKFSRSDMLFSIPDFVINLQKSQGKANLLANPRIRVANKKKAKIHVGDRVPTITSTVNNNVVTENVTYVDVGVKLNIEPTIHNDNDVTLKIKMEISSVGETIKTSQSTVFRIGTRNAETELRLHDGETQVIGGLISETERTSTVKVPFFGEIPVLGRLFSSSNDTKEKTEIVLTITPHIVRERKIADPEFLNIWSGKAQELSSKPPFSSFIEEEAFLDLPPPGAGLIGTEPLGTMGAIAVPHSPEEENQEAEIAPAPVGDGGGASLIIDGPVSVNNNDEFNLVVSLSSSENVTSVPFYLRYDAALISFIRATEGDFLKRDGKSTAFMFNDDKKRGRVIVGSSRLGDQIGINGQGTVMTVAFKAIKAGRAKFHLENYRITGTEGKVIQTTVTEKSVQIL